MFPSEGMHRMRELGSGQANAAADGMDEYSLVGAQPGLHPQSIMRGDECLRDCGGFFPA